MDSSNNSWTIQRLKASRCSEPLVGRRKEAPRVYKSTNCMQHRILVVRYCTMGCSYDPNTTVKRLVFCPCVDSFVDKQASQEMWEAANRWGDGAMITSHYKWCPGLLVSNLKQPLWWDKAPTTFICSNFDKFWQEGKVSAGESIIGGEKGDWLEMENQTCTWLSPKPSLQKLLAWLFQHWWWSIGTTSAWTKCQQHTREVEKTTGSSN